MSAQTKYGIRHLNGMWWRGGTRWTLAPIAARWFATFEDAEAAALREFPDRSQWAIRVVV